MTVPAENRGRAVLQALFVTLLWSSSWVLIKTGLEEIPPLLFAGLRYFLAFLVLLPFALRSAGTGHGTLTAAFTREQLPKLVALGLIMYGLTQGAQFVALAYLPAQTTSLLLSFSPVLVALLGAALLAERPTGQQWLGVAVYLVGAGIFLYPAQFPSGQLLGLAVALVGLAANAGAAILGRSVNRSGALSPLTVTVVSMGVGAVALLVVGLVTHGMPRLSLGGWAIVAWLAVVNTALAFTLWNRSLRSLSAMESSVINNTMLIQIAVLAWIFLGEALGVKEVVGLGLAAVGTLVVQLRFGAMLARRRERPAGGAG